jgi:inner membrane protein
LKELTGKTHITGGVAAGAALSAWTHYDPTLMAVAGAVGGLLPDICHSGSKVGSRLPLLSKAISAVFGHRTFTHSLLFLLIAAGLLSYYVSSDPIRLGILAGMVSHLLLDAATRSGIKFLYPFKLTFRFPFTTKTGGKGEHAVLAVLKIAAIYYFSKEAIQQYTNGIHF